MDILGTVDEITTDGRAIVQTNTVPDLGTAVYDSRNRRIGTIKRVFGPVDAPYISVRIDEKSELNTLKGKSVFFEKRGSNYGKGKGRNRRD